MKALWSVRGQNVGREFDTRATDMLNGSSEAGIMVCMCVRVYASVPFWAEHQINTVRTFPWWDQLSILMKHGNLFKTDPKQPALSFWQNLASYLVNLEFTKMMPCPLLGDQGNFSLSTSMNSPCPPFFVCTPLSSLIPWTHAGSSQGACLACHQKQPIRLLLLSSVDQQKVSGFASGYFDGALIACETTLRVLHLYTAEFVRMLEISVETGTNQSSFPLTSGLCSEKDYQTGGGQ